MVHSNLNIQLGWLPQNFEQEFDMGNSLLDHVLKKTTYTLDSFARSNEISPKDIDGLSHGEGGLPDVCSIATEVIKTRQEEADAFCVISWRGNDGYYYDELQLRNEATGEWITKNMQCFAPNS